MFTGGFELAHSEIQLTDLKKHKRAVRYANSNDGIAVHANSTHHDIAWDRAEVLDREDNWHKKKACSLEKRKTP